VTDIITSIDQGKISLTATEVKIILGLPKMLKPILVNIALANPTLPALAKMNVEYMHNYECRLDRLLKKLTQLSEARAA
jgi:hypothetical protein